MSQNILITVQAKLQIESAYYISYYIGQFFGKFMKAVAKYIYLGGHYARRYF